MSGSADLFDLLHAIKGSSPFGPAVDEAALEVAQRARDELSRKLDLSLGWDGWTQLTAILQTRIAIALRHAVFDKPAFPPAGTRKAPHERQ